MFTVRTLATRGSVPLLHRSVRRARQPCWYRRWGVLALLAPRLFDIDVSSARAQTNLCDPYLPVSTQNPFGYRPRGDRCEGIYIQQVSNTPLLIASFAAGGLPASVSPQGSVDLHWARVKTDVRLRAYSLRPRTYYRMDTVRPPEAGVYRWSTDVLAALKLSREDVGVVAWTEQNVGGVRRAVYLPVRLDPSSSTADGTYDLLLIPGIELREVTVSVTPVGDGAADPPAGTETRALDYRYYPVGRPIRIVVGPLRAAGFYLLEVGATLRDGGAASQELLFLHAPRGEQG